MTVVAAPALSNSTLADIVLIAVAVIVLVGLGCVALHRLRLQQRRPDAADASMTRPVLAVLLVGTLLILAAASLTFADAQARNLLIGGVVSLGSAAAAFYFASSNATEARRDLLVATGTTVEIPQLVGKPFDEAQALAERVGLTLVPQGPVPGASARITGQDPPPGPSPRGARSVRVFFDLAAGPPRDTGQPGATESPDSPITAGSSASQVPPSTDGDESTES